MAPRSTARSQVGIHAPESSYIDPAALMRIKNLRLRAKVVVDGFFNGLHRSPYHGFSVEFSEYRPYSPGDDPRYLDWKLYARSDRHHIKKFEDETNRRCYLLLDLSQSMAYTSLSYDKAEYARSLAATFAYYLTLERDSVGLQIFDDTVSEFIAARRRPGQLHQLLAALHRATAGRGTNLVAPIEQIASLITKRGLIVLISDLLTPLDRLGTNLSYLRSRGHEVLVLRVLDPAEMTLSISDATMLWDLETGEETFVNPAAVRDEYLRRFRRHGDALDAICADLGIDLATLSTGDPLESALLQLLSAQLRRGRRGGAAGRIRMTASPRSRS